MVVKKKKINIDRFYDRIVGVLVVVRFCGIVVVFCEMFICELFSKVFFFIFNLFGRMVENFSRLKVFGYDCICDFYFFLERLVKRGNLGV